MAFIMVNPSIDGTTRSKYMHQLKQAACNAQERARLRSGLEGMLSVTQEHILGDCNPSIPDILLPRECETVDEIAVVEAQLGYIPSGNLLSRKKRIPRNLYTYCGNDNVFLL